MRFQEYARLTRTRQQAAKQMGKAQGLECNTACWLATEEVCTCVCNGLNHGSMKPMALVGAGR